MRLCPLTTNWGKNLRPHLECVFYKVPQVGPWLCTHIYGTVYRCSISTGMHDPENSVRRVLKTFLLVINIFHRGCTHLPLEAIGPGGSNFFSRGASTSTCISKEAYLATCYFPGEGVSGPTVPTPYGSAYVMY